MAWANDFADITSANAGAVDMQLSFWQIDDPSAYVLIKYDQTKLPWIQKRLNSIMFLDNL